MFEHKIISYLQKTYKPSVILFIGSRANGAARDGSDWDLFCVGNYSKRESYGKRFLKEHLDIVLLPIKELKKDKFIVGHYYGPFQFIKAVWWKNLESQKLSQKIVQTTKKAYDKGFNSKLELKELQAELQRRISKMQMYREDPFTVADQKGLFFRISIEYWCKSRGMWPLPPKDLFPLMRRMDYKTYCLYVRYIRATQGKDILRLAKEIARK